ncbi:hypothetical protein JTE90_001596 [Oedothorax gibbosus]|uniref:Serine/threonine-protein phosphatase 4 regulatory subunit 2 n=1 Tax=Oedothorax gibbosus TaxID=931172 RepID=A0AAV6VLJ3_9ARAC|nr:hypothetical protein JTE90_001596 [Oedothorax gibbosus]
MEWNAESVLDALNDFERKSEIPEILDQYLERIAKNGEIVFPWNKLKPLLKKKLEFVLDEFYETCPVETSNPIPNFEAFNFENLKKTILQAVDAFTSAPFTIQRLCELVTNPTKHYNRTDKYMRGIEKNVLVVSTIEPRSEQLDGVNANNPIVNGMPNDSPRDDNDALNGHENAESVSSSNLNTPSNHVLLENFANVFPSAVCIPPSTDICEDSEVDNNFMENSETELAPVESIEEASVAPKDEEMDTTEDDRLEDVQQPEDITEEAHVVDDTSETQTSQPESGDKIEMESIEDTPSESSSEPTESIPPSEPIEIQPSEEVPPIKEDTQISEEPNFLGEAAVAPPEQPNPLDEVAIAPPEQPNSPNFISDVATEEVSPHQPDVEDVSQDGDSTSEPSELCMDSESSTSSNEPDPPV